MSNLLFSIWKTNNDLNEHFQMKISQLHVFIIPIWPPNFHHGGHIVFWFNFVHTYFQFFYYNFAQERPIYVFEVPKCSF